MAEARERRSSGLPSRGFARSLRLTLPSQFKSVLQERASVRHARFALHLQKNASGSAWRLGLVIPKRFEASAARRNLIRRTFREAFRRARASLESCQPGHDLVVRLHAKGPKAGLAPFRSACHAEAEILFAQLFKKLGPPAIPALPCVPS